MWSIKVISPEKTLVPETEAIRVLSLSKETAFQGVEIHMEDLEYDVSDATEIFLKRHHTYGHESWRILVKKIFDDFVRPDGLFSFSVEGDFRRP